ncbi:hypothetical protein EU245_08775 [Lentibacillus lipolyticus]|nr:hypothetical protein EU245_08775 [Lentibacillus lipolyticus]
MNKGMVMEVHRRYIIVMRSDGTFQKALPIPDAAVGMEVCYQPLKEKRQAAWHLFGQQKIRNPFRITAMACVLFLLFIPVYVMMDEEKAYAYVNVAINPNMELEIDDKLKVRSIEALNDDAEVFLKELENYRGKTLEEVLQIIMQETEKTGMLDNGKNMLVGVSYMLDSHETSVTEKLETYFSKYDTEWKITTFQIPKDVWNEARDKEQSMNQIMAKNLDEADTVSADEKNPGDDATPVDDHDKEMIHSFYNTDGGHDEPEDTGGQGNTEKKKEIDATSEPEKKQSNTSAENKQAKQENHVRDQHKAKHPGKRKSESGGAHAKKVNKGKHHDVENEMPKHHDKKSVPNTKPNKNANKNAFHKGHGKKKKNGHHRKNGNNGQKNGHEHSHGKGHSNKNVGNGHQGAKQKHKKWKMHQ